MLERKRVESFLFQTGAIKSPERADKIIEVIEFLFQTGAIKSRTGFLRKDMEVKCFYSKLVRLKDVASDVLYSCHELCFYSKLVRLKDQLQFEEM